MIKTILPGQTIGIIGGGQLGRMLAMSAKEMGYDATKTFEDRLTQLIDQNEVKA